MEFNIANILMLFAIIISSAVARPDSAADIKQSVLDSLSGQVCPPFGKQAKFEAKTINTKTQIYGCAYMGSQSTLSLVPLFHLWLESPIKTGFQNGSCGNLINMDHFMFECLAKHKMPNKDESEMGWHYISLLEHSGITDAVQGKNKSRPHRCALYDVFDEDDRMIRIIRMVISKPVISDEFNIKQCNGLSDLLARDLLPVVPEGFRFWPDGSMYIYLIGRKAKSFYTKNPKYSQYSRVTSRPTTTTSRPSTTTTTTRRPTTTRTTTRRPTTTTTTTTERTSYFNIDDFFRDLILFQNLY